jgi:hypothetical protein
MKEALRSAAEAPDDGQGSGNWGAMSNQAGILTVLLFWVVGLAVTVGIIFLMREVWCWYWKINELVALQREILATLQGRPVGESATSLRPSATPTTPAPTALPPSQLEWQGRGYAAERLFEVGKQWALLFDKTKDPAHRGEALAAMSTAASIKTSAAKAGYFDSFGSLMGDPDFTRFTSV